MNLQEAAQLEGVTVTVEWQGGGAVTVHFPAFSQFMWCQDDTLHVRFDEPPRQPSGR